MRLIDADMLLDRVEWANTNPLLDHGKTAVELIKAAPTIEERKTGRWIDRGYMKVGFHCSECGGYSIAGKDNYCPNCGAKMEKGAER